MFTFIFWTVLCSFHSIQGLIELPQDIVAASELLKGVSSQILASNDSKLQEFAVIFNHYVNLTEAEKESREVLSRLATESNNSTGDDENEDLYGSLAWETALDDALAEENITVDINKLLNDTVVEYLETYASNPENVKALDHLYQQRLDLDRKPNLTRLEDNDLNTNDTDATGSGTGINEENPFWNPDDTPTRRIYKGKRVNIQNYPFIVSVHILNVFYCAGSIIKDDLVITAASCLQLAHNNRFYRENPSFIAIRAGSNFHFFGGEIIPVMGVYFHPSYDPKTLRGNLAVMQLQKVLNFKHKNVKKIQIDRSAAALPDNTPPITILGWGAKTESNLQYHRKRLHAARLDFYDRESCREIYGKKFVTRTNFCAGFISRGEGACNLDVGDPGVTGMYLVGVTSFGSPICGRPDTPTVFTKVGFYADWIQDLMDQKKVRLSHRTTTVRPFRVLDKKIILYGIGGESDPIPLQREGTNTEPAQDTAPIDEHLEIVLNELKKLGMQSKESADLIRNIQPGTPQEEEVSLPDEEQDPEIKYNGPSTENNPVVHQFIDSDRTREEESGNALRKEDQHNKDAEAKEEEEAKKTSLEETKVDRSDSDSDGITIIPVDRATKVIDFDPKPIESREIRKTDLENVRVTNIPDNNFNMDSESDFPENAASAKKSVTDNVDPVESISRETGVRLIKKQLSVVKKDDTVLRKKHRNPTVVNFQFENIHMPKHTNKHTVHNGYVPANPPNILGNAHPIDFEYDGKNIIPKYQEYHEATQNENKIQVQHPEVDKNVDIDKIIWKESREFITDKEETGHAELANDIADDIVKHEIQKLIEQLEISSELNSQTEDYNSTNHSPLRNNLKNIDTDKTKDSGTILTFLYLTDVEEKVHRRAKLIDTRDEGLSIDPKPFKKEIHGSNQLIGKSEIYKIFADVMNID
ncbi:uncharacterized protein LOC134751206 [Cydia strobilella]|uniref:uncharacterized protein LOC134751206 n=1 Tax=Cydia strobilella TaxID=1100964 RepID=UPI0030058241